jgi:hypothetical protein
MITVGDKTIKLQIWDTVTIFPSRLDNSLSSLSHEDTTDLLPAPSLSTTLLTVSPTIMFPVGWKRLKSTVTLKCVS